MPNEYTSILHGRAAANVPVHWPRRDAGYAGTEMNREVFLMVMPEPPIVTPPSKKLPPSCWETVLLMMIACVLPLAGCSRTLTPGSAVQRKLGIPNDIFAPTLEDVQVLGVRDWPGDPQQKIVLFRAHMKGAENGELGLGFTLVIREGVTWRVREQGSGPSNAHPPDEHKYSAEDGASVLGSGHDSPNEAYYIAYGESPNPDTVTVEGRFDNGHITSDSTTAGAYILVGLNARAVCELRMLDANKRVVSMIDLSPPQSNCVK